MTRFSACCGACLLLTLATADAAPDWIAHASRPGADIPASGESRFDQLFRRADGVYDIPYPLAALIERLESLVDNGAQSGVRLVYIPRGRSLQREAPAPDYFRFPRAVVAVEGEPATTPAAAGEVLEYRLFIAHQPKTESLEIISYNDEAGRFEFQVVDSYAHGAAARVRPANRAMCLSCHQNAAPIFARRPWSETTANHAVASRLAAALPREYDSLIDVITLDAGIIDLLSERANYLSAAQLIWQRGCSSAPCRAAMLRALLQYRLSGKASFETRHRAYRRDYLEELTRNWDLAWPRGLALASSRIADRDPFDDEPARVEQDPLHPRPAHANWYAPDRILANGIIYRLAGFLTLADIRRIDRHLGQALDPKLESTRRLQARCRTETRSAASLSLVCGEHSSSDQLRAKVEIEIGQQGLLGLPALRLQFPRDPGIWQARGVDSSRTSAGLRARVAATDSGLSLRLGNGNRVESLQLLWQGELGQGESRLEIDINEDFGVLDDALQQMLRDNRTGSSDSLGDAPFRRQAVMRDLMRALGMPALDWRQARPASAAANEATSAELDGDLALLIPYCAHCHGDASVNPPGFLYPAKAQRRIRQCAPRILRRLLAWQDTDFPHSPMPPPASLAISTSNAQDWPRSEHYRALSAAIEKLALAQYGQAANDWRNQTYDRLPPCLLP